MRKLRAIFGKNLETARKKLDLSREKLSVIVDIDAQSIRNYEKGDRWPDPEVTEKLATALKIHVSDLYLDPALKRIPTPEEALNVLANFVKHNRETDHLSRAHRELMSLIPALDDVNAETLLGSARIFTSTLSDEDLLPKPDRLKRSR